jgi:hypothetical protein
MRQQGKRVDECVLYQRLLQKVEENGESPGTIRIFNFKKNKVLPLIAERAGVEQGSTQHESREHQARGGYKTSDIKE